MYGHTFCDRLLRINLLFFRSKIGVLIFGSYLLPRFLEALVSF